MAKISKDLGAGGTLHPRENLFVTGSLGSLNAEVIVDSDGCSTFALDLRGTFSLTIEVAGTVDGTNWTLIPVRPINVAAVQYVAAITGTVAGIWFGECAGFNRVRARVTSYTSGSATTYLSVSTSTITPHLRNTLTTSIGTTVGASGAATTLTLASPGAGLRHYLTYLSVNRFAAALLVAGAAPVTVTTTNLPGTLAFSFPAEAAGAGTLDRWREDFAFPITSSAQGTATTIVCPATTNVIWRVTAGFYVAP
jgi:hypothetical protein